MSFACSLCHARGPFALRCAICGKPNTMRPLETAGPARAGTQSVEAATLPENRAEPMREHREDLRRALTGLGPLDRILGGGLVESSAVLLSGDKGVGKSTLILHLIAAFSARSPEGALLVSSEETRDQVEYRVTRTLPRALGAPLLCTTSLSDVLLEAESRRLTVIDSLHMLSGKVEENAFRLVKFCKARRTTLVCVAQVIKDGRTVRGGGELPHIFDAHIQVQREPAEEGLPTIGNAVRRLVSEKNRFGPEGWLRARLSPEGWEEVPDPPPPPASTTETKAPPECTSDSGAQGVLVVLKTPRGDPQ